MPAALICSTAGLEPDLGRTLLWRDDIERHFASRRDEALMMVVAARPVLVVVDRDLPDAARLVAAIRTDASARSISVVIAARGDFEHGEVELLEAGANAVLRLPAGPEWDERLVRLLSVPPRLETRIPVCFEVTRESEGALTLLGVTVNLSARGMLLETAVPLSMGEDIDFSFRLPDAEVTVKGCGRVLRQATPRRFGIEFYGLEADAAEHIRSYVARVAGNGL
jgi:CheY-like chemotaxis protein